MRTMLSAVVIAAGLLGVAATAQAAPAGPVSAVTTQGDVQLVQMHRGERRMMRHRMMRHRMMRHRMMRHRMMRHRY